MKNFIYPLLFTLLILSVSCKKDDELGKKDEPEPSKPFNTTKIVHLSLLLNGNIYYGSSYGDTIYVTKPYDGVKNYEILINEITLSDSATCTPTQGEKVIVTNNIGSINITAQDKITTKTIFIKMQFYLPKATTYSGETFMGIAIRDTILTDNDTIISISNVANQLHSFTFGTKSGAKQAQNGKLILTKEDLGVPSGDGITFNLTTGGSNLLMATYKMYEIRHWKDLQAIRFYTDGSYILINDILFPANYGFKPIEIFGGKLQGNYKSIKNIKISTPSWSYTGLVRHIGKSSEISDLTINYDFVDGGYIYAGGLAGHNEGKIINCHVTGMIKGDSDNGGLVGLNENIISNSSFSGTVRGTVFGGNGGLVGENKGTISNSHSAGEMINNNYFNGGLVGNNGGIVTNSYSLMNLTGYDNIAGLVGKNSGTISYCFALNNSVQPMYGGSPGVTFNRIAASNTGILTSNKANRDLKVMGVTRSSTDSNGLDGEDIDTSNLTQSVFEDSGWDFNKVWVWDQSTKLPKLR